MCSSRLCFPSRHPLPVPAIRKMSSYYKKFRTDRNSVCDYPYLILHTTYMNMYVGDISALYYWRDGNLAPEGKRTSRMAGCFQNVNEFRSFKCPKWLFGSRRLHLIVPEDRFRHDKKEVNYQVFSSPLPANSFHDLGGGLFVAAPELCFVQMARQLSTPGLIALGLELCGTYRLSSDGNTKYNCDLLTNAKKLRRYVNSIKKMPGIENARRAANYIINDSASPMETQLYIRLCLPKMLGGYACPKPELNALAKLTKSQQAAADRTYLKGDLYWSKKRMLVEYNGEDSHTGRERITRDALRSNAVNLKNIKMFLITADIFNSFQEFDTLAKAIKQALGKREQHVTRTDIYKRRHLLAELKDQEEKTK